MCEYSHNRMDLALDTQVTSTTSNVKVKKRMYSRRLPPEPETNLDSLPELGKCII